MRRLLRRATQGRRRASADGEALGALRRAGLAHRRDRGPQWLHDFSFAAVLSEIPPARRLVAEFAEDCGLQGPPLFDLLLAVGEALANAVKHGSPRRNADWVRVRVGAWDHAVAVEIKDNGQGFGASRLCAPDVLESGGRGIPFMRALVDDLQFECSSTGTTVVLLKHMR